MYFTFLLCYVSQSSSYLNNHLEKRNILLRDLLNIWNIKSDKILIFRWIYNFKKIWHNYTIF